MADDAGRKEVDAALETLERRIIREYAQAETEVQTKMDTFLKKFEAQDKEFKALVERGEMDVGKYIQWRQKQILTSTYWRDMRDTLAQDYINVDKIVKHMTGEHVYDVYAMGRNYGAYEIEHGTSLDTSFTLYNHEAVERLIRDDPDLLPMPGEATRKSISEGKLKAWNRKQLQSAMTQSILQGEPIDKIAKRVATAVGGMDTKAAIRTARTATTSAESAGRRDSYKRAHNMGIKLKQMWVATLDGRTRHEHRQLDGQTCEVDGKFKIDGYEIEYPGDPTAPGYLVYNCRCAMVAVIPGTQLAERGITGVERDDRLEGMSYEEWKNEHAQQGIAAPREPTIQQRYQTEIQGARDFISNHSGDWQLSEIKTVGQRLSRAISNTTDVSELQSQYNALAGQYSENDALMQRYMQEYRDIEARGGSYEEEMAISQKLGPLYQQNAALHDQMEEVQGQLDERKAQAMRAVLSEIRPMGGVTPDNALETITPTNTEALARLRDPNRKLDQRTSEALARGLNAYPTEWIDASREFMAPLEVEWYNGRCNYEVNRVLINDQPGVPEHELAHRMEHVLKGSLRRSEQLYYEERTQGCPLEEMEGYVNEKARKDTFVSEYMGKDYGGQAYELLSTSYEYMHTQYHKMEADPDMIEWTLGTIATQ